MKLIIIVSVILCYSFKNSAQTCVVTDFKLKTEASNFCPTFWQDKLVFTSNMKDKGHKNSNYSNLYVLNNDVVELLSPVLKSDFHDGPASFNKQGSLICYSSNVSSRLEVNDNLFIGLFFSSYANEQWSPPTPFAHNSNSYHVAYPSLTPDGKTLYFASTMPGGFGGLDLYVSHLKDGNWTKPQNLGPNVNSSKDEQFPYIHASGYLYFSSNTVTSLGGLDIFYTYQTNREWNIPKRLSEPINSSADDFGIHLNSNRTQGYFSSSRKEGLDHIYTFEYNIPEMEDYVALNEKNTCLTFFESGPSSRDSVKHITHFWKVDGKIVGTGLELPYCFDTSGIYTIDLWAKDALLSDTAIKVATYQYEIKPRELPYIEGKIISSSKKYIILDASKTKIPTFRWNDMLWQVNGEWYAGPSIILNMSKANSSFELLLLDDTNTTNKCYFGNVQDFLHP